MRQALFDFLVSIILVAHLRLFIKEGVAMVKIRRRSHRRRNVKKKWIILFLLLIVITCFFSFKLRPMIQSITETVAKQAITLSIEETVKEKLTSNHINYNDFIKVERDNSGNILSISSDMVQMNQFKAEITTAIQDKLLNQSAKTGVPVGTLLGSNLLRGYGPKIPLKIGLIGNVDINFKSSFESAGINQTIHRIYLTIYSGAYSYLPGVKNESDVDTTVIVAETVIVGDVPSTYANFQFPNMTSINRDVSSAVS